MPSKIAVPRIDLEWDKIKEVHNAFDSAGCGRRLLEPLSGTNRLCQIGHLEMDLVGQYLNSWHCTPYWREILRGGTAGFSLCLHELVEIEWYFRHYSSRHLDPYDQTRRPRPSGIATFDQQEGYLQAHSHALLVEHRYIQLRCREDGEDFSLKELVLTNPHGWNGHDENVNQDWQLLTRCFGQQLAADDCRVRVRNLDRAGKWYASRGYRRPMT